MEIDDIYLDNLDEYINDENKIVTYKWLSRTLAVHVNQAKQMLYAFVQQQKEQKKTLSVTYSICGFLGEEENKVLKVQIVPEEQLEETKSHMQPLSSCHIYSVQKSQLKDSNVLYMADYDLLKENIFNSNNYSAIKCTAAKVRSEEEVERLRRKTQPTNAPSSSIKPLSKQNGTTKPQSTKRPGDIAGMFASGSTKTTEKTETNKSHSNKSDVKGESSDKSTKQNGSTKPESAKRAGGIAGMFAAGSAKAKTNEKTVADKAKTNEKTVADKKHKESDNKQESGDKKSSNKAKQGGVMSFLANQANKPKKKEEPVKADASGDGDGEKVMESPKKKKVPTATLR